jgi:hypothetical protein
MDYKIIPAYLTNNDCYRLRRFRAGDPDGVVVHSTATRGVMFNRGLNPWCKRWNKPGVEKLVHFMIDDTGIYQTQELAFQAWHVGGSGNANLIGFEICEPVVLTDRAYFDKVYPMAVWLVAHLVKLYGWKVLSNTVMGHYEAHKMGIGSNHADPGHWFPKMGKSMVRFRADVQALLKEPVKPDRGDPDRPAYIPEKMPLLKLGSTGQWVKLAQELLEKKGYKLPKSYKAGKLNGVFFIEVYNKVRAFQRDHGLLVDGKIGKQTWTEFLL